MFICPPNGITFSSPFPYSPTILLKTGNFFNTLLWFTGALADLASLKCCIFWSFKVGGFLKGFFSKNPSGIIDCEKGQLWEDMHQTYYCKVTKVFFFSKSSSCWISIYDKFTRAWIFCTAPIISAKSLEQQQFVKNSKYWQLSIMEFAKATWSRRQNSTLLIALNAYDFWTVWQLNPFPYNYHLFLKNICLGKSSWHNEIWRHDFSQRLRDIISQPLLKSTCVFGPKKGVTCRPVYDNKFCFLSCIVGTCADGPIFLFKVERANKKNSRSFITLPFFCVSHQVFPGFSALVFS